MAGSVAVEEERRGKVEPARGLWPPYVDRD
jgi:hypothetical protein